MKIFGHIVATVLLLFVFTGSLFASPFDPRFIINLDELCANGDLALSIPLFQLRLDDTTTIAVRLEHNLKTGDYDYAQSEIVLRPLTTTLTPYNRGALLWKKPNGSEAILRAITTKSGSPEQSLPEAARAVLASKSYTTYSSRDAVAWATTDASWCLILSEKVTFYYERGLLAWFILPSGVKISATNIGNTIQELRNNGALIFSIKENGENAWDISGPGQQIRLCRDTFGRIRSLTRPNGMEVTRFEYAAIGFLSTATFKGNCHRYSWAKTQRPQPAIIDWVKPYHIQCTDRRIFDYKVTNENITLRSAIDIDTAKIMKLGVRFGNVISISEK